uniref:Uncharacterized protein n=1 Tax=Anguilla anguilla TaxID=7936 RepID=A0A0E9U7H5_ANGAN
MAHHFARRSQKSRSEHDLFDNRPKGQAVLSNTWRSESNQVLSHKAWTTPDSDRLLDELLDEKSNTLDVLYPHHIPYMQKK